MGEISHSGKITAIDPQMITVEFTTEDACASCKASALCGISEGKVKTLQVPAKLGFEIGEEVDIVLKRTMGLKAVWLAYVLPLILMVAVLLALTALGLSELTAGLCAIAAVGLWYLVLWLMRDKLKNEYTFYIKKK